MKRIHALLFCIIFAATVYSNNTICSSYTPLANIQYDKFPLIRRHQLTRNSDLEYLTKDLEHENDIQFIDEPEQPVNSMTNLETEDLNAINLMMENVFDDDNTLEIKCREVYENGMRVIKKISENIEKVRDELQTVSRYGNASAPGFAMHFHKLQMSVSLHSIQLLKIDSSVWGLLDGIAMKLGLEDTGSLDQKCQNLMAEIYHYEEIIQAKIFEIERYGSGTTILKEIMPSSLSSEPTS